MVTDAEVKRINELAKKSKETGLTEEEQAEQKVLRQKYIDAMKASLQSSIESIRYVEDGEAPKRRH
ncbi:DUF896 domain-containing protein [Brevibacillus daliensis]|uniref:DUF896 domain-containing protein n=1 Tax=Brevibacillus daliensis TaxID=2892995 RepID=UPI001E499565|nr:DUF896 domain-containing protein [Brevibacillus daliensis]